MGRFPDSHINRLYTTPSELGITETLLECIVAKSLLPAASAYIDSVNDLFWLGSMPTWIAYYKEREVLAEREAGRVVDGRTNNPGKNSYNYHREVLNLKDDYLKQDPAPAFLQDVGVGPINTALIRNSDSASKSLDLRRSCKDLRRESRITYQSPINTYRILPPELRRVYTSIMKSQIILAWPAFETLAGDLFKVARDNPLVAELTGEPLRIVMLAEEKCLYPDQATRTAAEAKLNANYGRKTDVKFAGLTNIRCAYSRGFQKAPLIDNALRDVSLDKLSQVRNCLVHSAGIADDKYLPKALLIPGMQTPSPNDAINIDGDISCALYNPVLKCGGDLIQAVDGWLTDNK